MLAAGAIVLKTIKNKGMAMYAVLACVDAIALIIRSGVFLLKQNFDTTTLAIIVVTEDKK